jgi:type III secretion system (T3SS) SseB-like protein
MVGVTQPPHDPPGSARRIPDAGFAGDTGAPPPALAAALAAYAGDPGRRTEAIAALQRSRLLVPVVAVLGEVEVDEAGLAHDKTSDMAAVLLTGADGRLALLAFTGLESLRAWDPGARPVPVTSRTAAQSALQDGAAALVVDVAGPTTLVVEGEDLRGIAAGWTLARVGSGTAWIGRAPE